MPLNNNTPIDDLVNWAHSSLEKAASSHDVADCLRANAAYVGIANTVFAEKIPAFVKKHRDDGVWKLPSIDGNLENGLYLEVLLGEGISSGILGSLLGEQHRENLPFSIERLEDRHVGEFSVGLLKTCGWNIGYKQDTVKIREALEFIARLYR
jgi:hypothetical protein